MKEAKLEATGVFIPIAIWENKDLSWLEKCLLAEIHACGGHRGACGATNETLATTMGMTPGSVAVAISRFRKFDLVKDVDGKCRRNLKTSWDGLVMAKDGLVMAKDGLVMAKDGLVMAKDGLVMAKPHIDNKEDKIPAPLGASSLESGKEEPENRKFILMWIERFKKQKGFDCDINWPRDMKIMKTMMAEPGTTAEFLMSMVEKYWDAGQDKRNFNCKNFLCISQFASADYRTKMNAELAASGVSAPRPEGIPSQADVMELCKEKWGEDQRHTNWGASFYRFWDSKEWKRRGLLIDWRVELSNQVNQWRKEKSE